MGASWGISPESKKGKRDSKGWWGWKWEEGDGRSKIGVEREVEKGGEGWRRVAGWREEEGKERRERDGGERRREEGICSPYARFVMLGVRRVGGGENRSVSLTPTQCVSLLPACYQLVTSFSCYSRESLVLLSHKLNVNFHVHEQLHIVFHRKRS